VTLKKSPVRHQWDPERNLKLGKLDRRAIQIGIRGWIVEKYVNEWIINLEEVTELAHSIHDAIKTHRKDLPSVPTERVYPVDETLQERLGVTHE
jgi:predicted transcriptional regulator